MGDIVRNVLQMQYHKKHKCDILGKQRWRVVSPRGTRYQNKQKLVAGGLAAEPWTLRASSPSPCTALEPALLSPDINPSSHRHTRHASLRHVRRFHPITHEETGTFLLVVRTIYVYMQSAAAVAALCVTILLLLLLLSAAVVASV